MEENKLTDEEIVKELINESNRGEWSNISFIDCVEVRVLKNAIDLIRRLQKENEELRSPKFASWKLKFFNLKEEFDKELAEHKKFTQRAKSEIERLTKEKSFATRKMKDIRLEVSPRVYNILLEFMKSLNIKSFGVKSKHIDGKQILTIYTNRPGLIIGKNGSTLQQLLNKIHEDILDKDINIALEEVDFFIRDDNESYTDKEFADEFNKYMLARGF